MVNKFMLEVTLTEQYQVNIPQEVRDVLHLEVGQKFLIVLKGDSIALVPKSSNNSFRGILKGANTNDIRDRSERI